jgi:DNA-binding Xre family transcriptional regulator
MMGEVMAGFKSHLKELMLKKSVKMGDRLTQQEVADATGLSLPTIGRWYRGEVDRIEKDTVSKFMKYFDCAFEDLISFED